MIEKFQLRNGVKVFLQESHRAPVVSIQVWVKTGSADEQRGQEGLTHFIEHLVFKGTKKFGPSEIAQLIEGAGGEINAYTSFDQTVYYITISQRYLNLALEALGEMIRAPSFEKNEIDNEREVVLEEIKRSNDSPARVSSNLLFSTVFSNHPYGRPVIGFPEIIKNTNQEDILKLFQSRYGSQNVFISIAGDFDKKAVKMEIERCFSMPARKPARSPRQKESKQTQVRIKTMDSKTNESYLNIAFRLPQEFRKKLEAYEVLAYVLGGTETSRLVQKLRLESSLANNVGCSLFYSIEPGFLVISVMHSHENLEKILEIIANELVYVKTELPTTEEIQNISTNLEVSEYFSQESVESLASRMGRYEHLFEDPRFFMKHIQNLKKVEPTHVLDITQTLLNTKQMSITYVSPAAKVTESVLQEWADLMEYSDQVPANRAKKKRSTKIKYKKQPTRKIHSIRAQSKKLKNGVNFIGNTNMETNVLSVQIGFLGGLRADETGYEGTSDLIANLWTSETKNLSELELLRKVESLGASVRGFSGRNSFGLSLDIATEFEKQGTELLEAIVTENVFNPDILRREKEIAGQNLKNQKDRPAQLVYYEFLKELFDNHIYAMNPLGTPESLSKITVKNLERQFLRTRVLNNMYISIAGNADVKSWENLAQRFSQTMKQGEKFEHSINISALTENKKSHTHLNREQSHIIYGVRGLTINSRDRYSLDVLQSVLSGQGGRLFFNLREKASLAYTVTPIRMDGLDTGCFGVYVGCSPEKAKKAIEMIGYEYQKLMSEMVFEAELTRSKKYLIGRHDIGLQRSNSVATAMLFNELYGIPASEIYQYAEQLNAVSSGDIQALAQKLFNQPYVITSVGPTEP